MPNLLLANAIDIRRWLEEDAEKQYEDRLARDREIGGRLDGTGDLDRVLGWWCEVAPGADAENVQSTGARAAALTSVFVALLAALGLVIGISLGTVALAYDGQYPVNLLALLGVLVGLPFLMLLLTLFFLLPTSIPGLSALKDGVSVVNPGRWATAYLDRFAGLNRSAGLGLHGGFGPASSAFTRWQIVVFSQWLAVGYFCGVLLSGAVLVAVTDLAFGWSSTLELDGDTVHRLFSILSLPWLSWFPGAVPDTALVEASRFYRLESAPIATGEAAALGGWWPFVLMTILIWGLAPRLTLLLIGRWRLSAATRAMLCQDPEVLALFDRMTPPRVDFGPEVAEDGEFKGRDQPAPPEMAWDDQTGVLIWNDALDESQAKTFLQANLGTSGGPLLSLGAGSNAADGLTELPAGLGKVVVFTKGWEPPLLEFADFLVVLRARLGAASTLVVVPVDTGRIRVDPVDREIWADFLGRHGDPRLYVFQATETGSIDDGGVT